MKKKTSLCAVIPNPSLDLSGEVKELIPNEKNIVKNSRIDPGGNAINAARICNRLGVRCPLIGFIGGAEGQQLQGLLQKEKLPFEGVVLRHSTRINVTVTLQDSHIQTRLTFPGPQTSPSEVQLMYRRLQKLKGPGLLVTGGSLPPGCHKNFYSRLLKLSHAKDIGMILDAPVSILQGILNSPHPRFVLLKPNRAEFMELAGRRHRSVPALAAEAKLWQKKHAALFCVSLGAEGALFAAQGKVWWLGAPKVRVRGSVGAGDSMVGAMAARLIAHELNTPEKIARASEVLLLEVFSWGLAAGTATAATTGTQLAPAALIRRLVRKVHIKKIFT